MPGMTAAGAEHGLPGKQFGVLFSFGETTLYSIRDCPPMEYLLPFVPRLYYFYAHNPVVCKNNCIPLSFFVCIF